jgi:hypothetical protein
MENLRAGESQSRLSRAVRDTGYMLFDTRGPYLSMRFVCVCLLEHIFVARHSCLISREVVFLHASVLPRSPCIATAILSVPTTLPATFSDSGLPSSFLPLPALHSSTSIFCICFPGTTTNPTNLFTISTFRFSVEPWS